jgi:hypothetical protein
MNARSIALAVVACLPAAHALRAASDEVPVLTVCEVLSDLDRYEGKSIIVVGRFGWTDEGSWLSEDCKLKVVRGGLEFTYPQISTAYVVSEFASPPELPKGFTWDKRLLKQKVAQLKRTTRLHRHSPSKYNDKWVAMFGRLETSLPREVRLANGLSATTSGFGHQSASPAQLIPAADGAFTIE